jgi:hypothetical protein
MRKLMHSQQSDIIGKIGINPLSATFPLNNSSSIHLHFDRKTAGFFGLVLFFMLCICFLFEVFASQSWFFNIIPYPSPSIGTSFPELDVKFQRLWKYGSPNCLIIGSSMADTGFNPAIFENLINEKYKTNYRCFNMGFSSSMVEVSAAVANSLIKWNKIDLIIWGISAIDMDPNIKDTRSIVDLPAFSYNNGHPSITGFLFNHFKLPWFLMTMIHQQNKEYLKILELSNNVMDNQGMRRSTKGKEIGDGNVMLPDFSIYPEDMKAFKKFTSEFAGDGKKIIVVEMPVNPDFYPHLVTGGDENYKKDFIAPIQTWLSQERIPFIRSQEKISQIIDNKTSWGNETHLNTAGAELFTIYIVNSFESEGILP